MAMHSYLNEAIEPAEPADALAQQPSDCGEESDLDHVLVQARRLLEDGLFHELESLCRTALRQRRADLESAGALQELYSLLSRARARLGNPSDARFWCDQALALRPSSANTLQWSASLYLQDGAIESALIDSLHCLDLPEHHHEAWDLLGYIFEVLGDPQRALAITQELVAKHSDQFEPIVELGFAQLNAGIADQALESFLLAAAWQPSSVRTLVGAGRALIALGQHSEALHVIAQGLELEEDNVNLLMQLGDCFLDLGQFDSSITAYRKALKLVPTEATLQGRLAVALRGVGELDESVAILNRLIEQHPEKLDFYQLQLFNYSILPAAYSRANLDLAARYWSVFRAQSAVDSIPVIAFSRDQERAKLAVISQPYRIRIGFLSAEIGAHVVSSFLRSFLQHYDRNKFTVELISTSRRFEEESEQVIALADSYIAVEGKSLELSRSELRARSYDIIVDTSGFTRNSGLALLAQRCAPIQCHYIGYHASTGLDTIDYFIADQEIAPDSFAPQFSERLIRLPRTWLAYTPEQPMPIASASSSRPQPILGSFNQVSKVREVTLSYWCQALRQVPGSVLLIKDRGAVNASVQKRVRLAFDHAGIDPDRVLFYPAVATREEHLECYNAIDVALDVTPWSSATTAFEALGMGVPLVAIRGDCSSARMSSSILTGIGRSEWIAEDPIAFGSVVADLCRDLLSLRSGKMSFQKHVLSGTLFDGFELSKELSKVFCEIFYSR